MKFIKSNKGALLIFVLFLIIGISTVKTYPKLELQIAINQFFHPVGNFIFAFFTRLAEPWFTVPLLIFLLVKNWRKAIYIGSVYAISALIAQWIKLGIFHGLPRPLGTIELKENPLYQWSSLDLPQINTFPSGHTTTGFCIFMGLALLSKNKKLGIPFMVIACLIGCSRTYLSYHFFIDVVAGGLIGGFTSIIFYLALKKPLKLQA